MARTKKIIEYEGDDNEVFDKLIKETLSDGEHILRGVKVTVRTITGPKGLCTLGQKVKGQIDDSVD